jgi:abortive infection bacteriophage resistance protein
MPKKDYQKTALTIDQQVELLLERGLIIDDIEEAKHYLNNIGYYHLSGYLKPFQNYDDTFKAGTSFTKTLDLYFFDRKLRLLFLNALERVEKSFKTQFVYHVSRKYGADGLTKDEIFSTHKKRIEENLKKSKEPFIRSFFKKYNNEHPPLWMIAEALSFGDILNIYNNSVETDEKKQIADFYGMGWKYLFSWMENLREVRNICAHYSRLWNRKITRHLKKGKQHTELRFDKHIYDSIIITTILLKRISPTYEWVEEVSELIKEYDINTKKMGFPENWEDIFLELINFEPE